MSYYSPQQEQAHIADHVPDIEQMAGPDATTLGSFVIKQLSQGDFVPLGNVHAIEVDFQNIDALTAANLEEGFEAYQIDLAEDWDKAALREALYHVPEAASDTFTAALYAVQTAKQFFGETLVDKQRRDNFGWRTVDEFREDSYKIKKLSETADDGVCAEYSLLVGEIMKRLGQDVAYTVGYRQDFPDEPGVYHAFLTSSETKVLVDVYMVAQTLHASEPSGLLQADEDSTLAQAPDDVTTYQDIFGRKTAYSASPILSQL